MTYGRMLRSPRHTKASRCVQNGRKQIFLVCGDESRVWPGPRETERLQRCNVLCAPRRKEKLQFFTPKSNSSRPPNRCADVFFPIPFRCDAKENENAFLMWMMRIFQDSKGTFRCKAIVVVLKVSFDLHLLEIQQEPPLACAFRINFFLLFFHVVCETRWNNKRQQKMCFYAQQSSEIKFLVSQLNFFFLPGPNYKFSVVVVRTLTRRMYF